MFGFRNLRRRRRYTAGNQRANLQLKYAGYQMLEIYYFSNSLSDPNFKDIKKLETAML